MKYSIQLNARARGIELINLTEEEKDELIKLAEEGFDRVYEDLRNEHYPDFELQFLTYGVDRYSLVVKDEDGEVVYESQKVDDLIDNDLSVDEDGEYNTQVGYEFDGIEDGFYLVRHQTLKGCYYYGEIELDDAFDPSRLYVIRDSNINDELAGDVVIPMDHVYYRRGDTPNPEEDTLNMEYGGYMDEQYFDTDLCEVTEGDYWKSLVDE